MYGYKISRLLIIAIIITYFSGCIWYFIVSQFKEPGGFYEKNFADEKDDNLTRLIICCYFALTTLATVGYGDYIPLSNAEILTAVTYMLCGVAFFSYIMGSFIEIISNY
jgi:hypothetical protein